ncbi:MAG: hypothetical protein U1F29_14345 [Planctomycetota bacterium]
MRPTPIVALAFALLLPACLETEERVTVNADGSLHVELRAEGDFLDLADGYPLPLAGAWRAQDDTTRDWIARVGADTGGARTRENAKALFDRNDVLTRNGKTTLVVAADFASAEELPAGYAPASEPYADAYLQRSTHVSIDAKHGRRVYVFERELAPRTFARFDAWSRMRLELDETIVDAVEHDHASQLDDAQRNTLALSAERHLREAAVAVAEDALGSLWTEGDASLSVAGRERCVEALRSSVAEVLRRERLNELVLALLHRVEPKIGDDEAAARFTAMEQSVRAALRSTLARELDREELAPAARNAVLGQLEWSFTAADQTNDLGDEALALRVRMPGAIVAGNHARVEDGCAVFELAGRDLRDRGVRLRVVSVVE